MSYQRVDGDTRYREKKNYGQVYIKEVVIRYGVKGSKQEGETVIEVGGPLECEVEVSYDWSHLRDWPKSYFGDLPPIEMMKKLVEIKLKGEWKHEGTPRLAPLGLPESTS